MRESGENHVLDLNHTENGRERTAQDPKRNKGYTIVSKIYIYIYIGTLEWRSKSRIRNCKMAQNPSLAPEIGPDGLAREAPVIAYTERVSISHTFPFPLSQSMHLFLRELCCCISLIVLCFLCQIIEEEQLQLKK